MGKKSDKIEAAKAKLKEVKGTKLGKSVVKEIEPDKPLKAVLKSEKKEVSAKPVEVLKEAKAAKALAKTSVKPLAPTSDEIRLEAYHIAQKRMANGTPGTEAGDWIAAEKALLEARGL